MRTEPKGGVPDSATFAQALASLKREGSNILLVGEDASDAHVTTCGRLLGDESPDSRYRLIVIANDGRYSGVPKGLCASDSEDQTRIVARSTESTVESPTDESPSDEPPADEARTHSEIDDVDVQKTVVESTLLGALGTEVIETVNAINHEAGELEPSELRVCLDSLDVLLESNDAERVFRFVHMIGSRVRQVNGMGHFHLPYDRDHDQVHLLEPLFDAVVEVRFHGGTTEHRWELRGHRTQSDWLPV